MNRRSDLTVGERNEDGRSPSFIGEVRKLIVTLLLVYESRRLEGVPSLDKINLLTDI